MKYNKTMTALGLEFRILFEYEELEGNRCILEINNLELIDKKGIIDLSTMLEEEVIMKFFEDLLMMQIQ